MKRHLDPVSLFLNIITKVAAFITILVLFLFFGRESADEQIHAETLQIQQTDQPAPEKDL